eukprot:283919-Amphidinium_carterae.1
MNSNKILPVGYEKTRNVEVTVTKQTYLFDLRSGRGIERPLAASTEQVLQILTEAQLPTVLKANALATGPVYMGCDPAPLGRGSRIGRGQGD